MEKVTQELTEGRNSRGGQIVEFLPFCECLSFGSETTVDARVSETRPWVVSWSLVHSVRKEWARISTFFLTSQDWFWWYSELREDFHTIESFFFEDVKRRLVSCFLSNQQVTHPDKCHLGSWNCKAVFPSKSLSGIVAKWESQNGWAREIAKRCVCYVSRWERDIVFNIYLPNSTFQPWMKQSVTV